MVGEPVNTFYVQKQVYDVDGKPISGLYEDLTGNGKVDEDDFYCYKKPAPDFTFGLNTNLTWKRWTLAASAHANIGNYVYNHNAAQYCLMKDLWLNNYVANRQASVMQYPFYAEGYFSDYFVENASFLKIDKVTVGYTLPIKRLIQDRSASINIFSTVQNVATITRYSGIDPEVFSGIDNNMYPRPRMYMLGLKFNF